MQGKVPVSRRAVVQRIQRRLLKESRKLICGHARTLYPDGRITVRKTWYVLSLKTKHVEKWCWSGAELGDIAKKLGVLHPWESL